MHHQGTIVQIHHVIKLLCISLCLLMFFSFSVHAQQSKSPTRQAFVPDELLVKFKPITSKTLRNGMRSRLRANVAAISNSTDIEHWKLAAGSDVQATAKQLLASGQVLYAEPNYRRYRRALPNDPSLSQQWALSNTGQLINDLYSQAGTAFNGTTGADMRLPTAWNSSIGSQNVVIAIVDDSVDINHPDLAANIWLNPNEIAGDNLDNDFNGFVDDMNGWDFYANDADPSGTLPDDGHGTAIAGCLGAVGNNNLGITGVNWNVSIMALRMGFDVASEIAAIDYAIANGTHILNASFGGPNFSQAEFDAFQRLETAGILVVVAAGNFHYNNDNQPDYPATFRFNNILSVAASTADDGLTSWSQFGLKSVDLAAPGTSIFTTLQPSTSAVYAKSGQQNLSYGYIDGTSFSAPYVAGIAGLIKALFPQATAQELKGRIMAAADLAANQIVSARVGLTATGGRADAASSLTITAQPVLVIYNLRIDDTATGNANGELDAGENIILWVDLENTWLNASNVSAVLSTIDPYVTINTANVSYPVIATSATAASLSAFDLTLSTNLNRHARVPFTLTVTAFNYTITRQFELEVGTLSSEGVLMQGIIQQDDQDDSHHYRVNVPVGASELIVTTTSAADIDLFGKHGSKPIIDIYTKNSMRTDGLERISFLNPVAGAYHFEVFNFEQIANTAYTIKAFVPNITPTITLDFDGDGVIDALDAFPTDIAASMDSDWDTVPDGWTFSMSAINSTTGLLRLDDFLLDAAASLDTDGDGFPDEWNINATAAQIAASNLTLDAYPNDPARTLDITPPVVTAPLDLYVTVPNANGLAASSPNLLAFFAAASAFDDVDAALPASPYNTPALFPVGTTSVNFIATDLAGNAGVATSSVTITVDAVAPVVTAPLSISIAATDPLGTLATDPYIAAFLNAATATDNIDGVLTSITHNAPAIFPAGIIMPVTFFASDIAGNMGTAVANVMVLAYVDTVPPVLTVPANITVAAVGPTGTLATDPYITAFLNGATALDNLDGVLNSITHNAPVTFPAATTTAVNFNVSDLAGNVSNVSANVTVLAYIDNVPPVLTIPNNITIPAIDPYGTLANDGFLNTFFNTASALDNVDGNITVNNSAPIKFPIGITLVDFYTSDLAGNNSQATATVTVLIFVDAIPPTIQVPATINVAATTPAGTAATEIIIVNFLNAATATDNIDINLTVAHNGPAQFQVGATQVDFYTSDTAGNTGIGTGTVIVLPYVDVLAPVLTLPIDIYVAATTPNGMDATDASIVAFIAAATATDNIDLNITVSNNAPVLFPVGATTVTFTAIDNSNNQSAGSALVTVSAYVDTVLPIVTAPNNIVVSAASATGTPATLAVLQQVLNRTTATDDFDPYSSVTHDAPVTFPIGTTTVTFSSTDAAGNTGTASNTVTVTVFVAGALNALAPSGTGLTISQSLTLGIDPYSNSLDADGDGILDWMEIGDINNPTDSDGDGLADVLEAGADANNASLASGVPLITGTVDIYSAGQNLGQVSFAAIGLGAPDTYSFPYGVIDYSTTVAAGQSTTVQLTFSTAFTAPVQLYKVDLAGLYVALPATAWNKVNANTIELILTDGDPLTDLDGTVNGVILDPLAVGIDNIPPPASVVGAPPFIAPPGQGCLLPVQNNHNMWFWLLALLMMGLVTYAKHSIRP